MKGRFLKFLKDWMLVIGMISGAGAYLIYSQIPSIHSAGPVLEAICRRTQPILLFLMLFISFCRIEPRQSSSSGGTYATWPYRYSRSLPCASR